MKVVKVLLVSILSYVLCGQSYAHPLDDLCNEGEMDSLLCAELSALDAPAGTRAGAALPEIDLQRSSLATAYLYTSLGIEHILPAG